MYGKDSRDNNNFIFVAVVDVVVFVVVLYLFNLSYRMKYFVFFATNNRVLKVFFWA